MQYNGMQFNGMQSNGMQFNGMQSNGMQDYSSLSAEEIERKLKTFKVCVLS